MPNVENAPVDIFTIAHVFGGALLWYLGMSRLSAYTTIVLFEILERPVFQTSQESVLNQVVDSAASVGGYEATRLVFEKKRK